ncbi:DUF1850 domain-containing protein [Halegenticoccus tardaugens]|uniref:DUF1850 domain-containing protein n=1 Tax=Halegenticoccus tardaugens TaxID=2071624 RepID=UPI00100AA5DA|nr:DUF1850 domain-containing protein [Halegenticoccus tardaugens]
MSGRFGRIATLIVVVASLAIAGVVVAAETPDRALVVEDAESGERLLEAPVENGATVALTYTHSVEKTPVRDVYVVRGDRLDLTRAEFSSYGWGFPADANVTRENGTFVYDPDVVTEEVYVSPGEVAEHRLEVDGRTHDLVELSDGETVRVHIERRTIFERIMP